MCQSGIDLHGLMLAVEQLSGREANLTADVKAWADYLLKQEVPEAAGELRNAMEALDKAGESFSKVLQTLEHMHDHGHSHEHHITATSFSEK